MFLRNRSPTKVLQNMTPYEVWTGRKPCVKFLRVFGSNAVTLDKTVRSKFSPKGKTYRMVGYSLTSKAYRLYNAEQRMIVEKRDVIFFESVRSDEQMNVNEILCINNNENEHNDLSSKGEDAAEGEKDGSGDQTCEENDSSEDSSSDYHDSFCETPVEEESPVQIGRGRPRIIRNGKPGRPRKTYNSVNVMRNACDIEVPQSVAEAESSEYANEWMRAMQAEYDALVRNNTWELQELPKGEKAIGAKWVFALKRDKDGEISRFKARLVAKGVANSLVSTTVKRFHRWYAMPPFVWF